MTKLIFTAAIVSLLTACAGTGHYGSSSGTGTMGAGAMQPGTMQNGTGPRGSSGGGPN